MNNISKLLSSERFRDSSVQGRNILIEAESDRGRLLFCPAFRRLQQKAQVFSMEPNAAVRSRLTHSFEVSQMGRYIADQISIPLIDKENIEQKESNALITFVETACLMHDIGNPPFGHFGEAAITEWFSENGANAIKLSCSDGNPRREIGSGDPRLLEALADFLCFDGNPQGLRVVTKLQRNSDKHGLNLTKTTLASYIKYVRCSTQKPEQIESPFTKKCGYFTTEKDIVESIWNHFGYTEPQRFPLAYVMEAADDIAYCISDLEDSIEKGLVSQEFAINEIHSMWKEEISKKQAEDDLSKEIDEIFNYAKKNIDSSGNPFTYTDFRTSLNRKLANYSADEYIKNQKEILSGKLPSLIPQDSSAGITLECLKSFCRENIYCHESVQLIELAGYTAIYGLLDHFRCLLECKHERFITALEGKKRRDSDGTSVIIESKLLSLFPKNYIKTYHDDLMKIKESDSDFAFKEWCLRAHLVTDFLSGMTDNFATETFQTLSGMKL